MKTPLELLRRMGNWQPERKLRLGYSPMGSEVRVRGAGDGAQWTVAVCSDRKDGEEGEKLPIWGGAEGELFRGKEALCRGHFLPSGLEVGQQKGSRTRRGRSLGSGTLTPWA